MVNLKSFKLMKKVVLVRNGGLRLAIMSMLTMFAFIGCSAHPSKASNKKPSFAEADSIMRTAIGDSIYKIIIDAKNIKAEEIIMSSDTTDTVAINVKGKFVPLIQFAITEPKIYSGNLATYANFMPCFKLIFSKKKEAFILNFDFGLKKWNICDATGKQIKMFDLSSDDMLRIANMLFPKNELYKNLINTDRR